VSQSISVATSWISPPLSTSETFKIYRWSSKGERGFCSDCGSSVTFQYTEQPERIEVFLGTMDEETLLGKKVGQESCGKYGMRTTREEALGTLLCQTTGSRNIWWENAIKNVTDDRPGLKYWREFEDGEGFENERDTREK
jgi:Glutathione-dependent formaldehyde-activating enzyme